MGMGAIMIKRVKSLRQSGESGFSLLETMFAMVIIAIGMLATLATIAYAVGATQTSQEDMIARQLASEAMESIFNARNTSQLGFSAINNVGVGAGIFIVLPMQPKCPGPDGILGTADDAPCLTAAGALCPNAGIECLSEPGPDGIVGNADDVIISLANFTRTIAITQLLDGNGNAIPTLVQVTVTINYTVPNHAGTKSYVLDEYISSYH
jgi:prepilin-type N-terminal cleavage/methylation domain-containing protein